MTIETMNRRDAEAAEKSFSLRLCGEIIFLELQITVGRLL